MYRVVFWLTSASLFISCLLVPQAAIQASARNVAFQSVASPMIQPCLRALADNPSSDLVDNLLVPEAAIQASAKNVACLPVF